jgi:16S rRNA processing protein RimM
VVNNKANMVVMGRVVAPYGVYGWVKVKPDTEVIDGLFDYDTWWLGKENQWREVEVETAKVHADLLLVKLAGIEDRDMAVKLKGQLVAVPRSELPDLDSEDEYYWSDLISLTVTNTKGIILGVIVDVFETGANDVIVVRAEQEAVSAAPNDTRLDKTKKVAKPEEKLLPFIADVVLKVDLQAKSMLVEWDADF